MHRYRIQVVWSGRADPLDRVAQQVVLLMTALESLEPSLSGWKAEDVATHAPFDVGGLSACKRAFEQAETTWSFGSEARKAHRPRFFLPATRPIVAELTVTYGVGPVGLPDVFAPDRMDLVLAGAVLEGPGGPALVENVLRAAAAVFRPDFGHAGTVAFPAPATSLDSDGRPVVGWMTYLSNAHGALPSPLPKPAVAEAVAHLGTLVVAHADAAVDGDAAQRAAVERVRAALEDAGTLGARG